ncbi:hypothetical protein [Massilia sp. LjRoot122]|uniref:hypothetical protein n=1 Tax=Massilia sp. LjRoot122 TaxID=3342257 RepID=UPI003ED0A6DD
MLSTATANRIADELLEQARSSRFGFTDPAGIPVAPLYRCRDLERLPQGLQLEIVDRATRETGATPLFIAAVTAWVLALASVYIVQPAVFSARMLPSGLFILAPLAPLLFRALLVRRAVRLIAGRIAAEWPVPVRM